LSNGSSSALPWAIAIVTTAIAAGTLGYFAGQYTAPPAAPVPTAAAPKETGDPGQLPPGVTAEKFGAWTVLCQEAPNGPKSCSAIQDVANERGQIVLSMVAGYDVNGQRALLVRVPLGIDLGMGLEFNLPGDKPVAFEFSACDQIGCNAILTVPEENFAKLAAAGSIELGYTRGDGVHVAASVKTDGMTEAYAKVERPAPRPAPAAPADGAPAAGEPAAETPAATPAPAGETAPQPTPKPTTP